MIGMLLTAAAVYPAIRVRAKLIQRAQAKPACTACDAAPSALCGSHQDDREQFLELVNTGW